MRPHVRITLTYAIAGVLWVIVSDVTLHALLADQPPLLKAAQIANGWLLVGCSALFIFFQFRSASASFDRIQADARESSAELRLARESIQQQRSDYDRLQAELTQELEQRETSSHFLSMLAHEFRTPLASIFATAELLDHYDQRLTPADRLRHYNIIRDQVRREIEMLDDLLTVMRGEKMLQNFRRQSLDLVALCLARIGELQPQVRPLNDIQFRSTMNTCIINGDERLLRQMLGSLIINAARYSPKGGMILVTLSEAPDAVRIQVKDNGIGVPEDDRERIFQPFMRGSNVGSISGAGLGLAIVRQAVQMHGGSIHLESQVDQGSTFTVTLPLTDS